MKALATLLLALPLLAVVDDVEVRKLLDNRVNASRRAMGIVIGILDEKGQRTLVEGKRHAADTKALDGDTVFEIGSITKVFTAILLADMTLRGEVKLDDPVAKYLPASVKIPTYEDRAITLADLTAQVSGLPRMPDNFHPADANNPYADYTVAQMYEFLTGLSLKRSPGAKYEYSNVGVGLLGHALSLRAGKPYEALVTERILKPLGMTRTSITLSAAQKANMAMGHTDKLAPASNWDLPTFAGAGALRSTANDMLRFLAANVGPADTPLRKAIALTHEIRSPTGATDMSIAMGWHIIERANATVTWHNGGTGGYRTWAGFSESKKTAVVVLCNTSFGVDDIGLRAMSEAYPARMLEQPEERKEISLGPEALQPFVGRYELSPAFRLTVTEEAGKLMVQATGQPKFALHAESPVKFFLKEVEAAVTFEKSETGEVTALILQQNGTNARAMRLPPNGGDNPNSSKPE